MEDELWDTATDINMGMDESMLSLVREKAVDLVQATLLIRTNPLHGSAPGYLQCCISVSFWVMLYGSRSCWWLHPIFAHVAHCVEWNYIGLICYSNQHCVWSQETQLREHAQKHSSLETRVDLHDGLDYSLQSYWHLCNLLHFCVCMVRMSLLWFLHMMAMPTGLQGTLMSNCLCTDQESLCVLLSWHRGTNLLCVALRRPSELTSWCCFLLVLWWDFLSIPSLLIHTSLGDHIPIVRQFSCKVLVLIIVPVKPEQEPSPQCGIGWTFKEPKPDFSWLGVLLMKIFDNYSGFHGLWHLQWQQAVLVASFVHRYLRRKRLLARAEQLYLQVNFETHYLFKIHGSS
jgi:hypothetical protein